MTPFTPETLKNQPLQWLKAKQQEMEAEKQAIENKHAAAIRRYHQLLNDCMALQNEVNRRGLENIKLKQAS